jgi:predicted dehydrogenase
MPGVEIAAVVDPDRTRAKALADRWHIPRTFGSVEELLSEGCSDVAHVLVPPHLHVATAAPLIEAGIHALVEKPMATSPEDAKVLLEKAAIGGAVLGVNQNYLFDPAFRRVKARIPGSSGTLRHLQLWLNLPLRQLAAGQFGSWMFRQPQNIIYEQAVHPLSQIIDLAGPVHQVDTTVGKARELAAGTRFYDQWQVSLRCESATAQLFMSFSGGIPASGMIAICDDELIVADFLNNRVMVQEKTRWLDVMDEFSNGFGSAVGLMRQSVANATNRILSTIRLKPRTDSFFLSMQGSIATFYDGLSTGKPRSGGQFGAAIIDACERIARDVADSTDESPQSRTPVVREASECDVAVIGGTGFIGRHVVRTLVQSGHRVRVMARNTEALPEMFQHPAVEVVSGSSHNRPDVQHAIANARFVVDLAHGGAANLEEIRERMIGGARTIAECCLDAGTERLVYVSSIAALYLGGRSTEVNDDSPVDPLAAKRGIYSVGKAACETLLMQLHTERELPVCVLRPGVVIGEGGLPYHSAMGTFVREKHCIGWNDGNNPLPLVLVDDVAAAVVSAMTAADVVGRSYNLVGDVRLTAREYVDELNQHIDRNIVFHGRAPAWLQSIEIGKWLIKAASRRPDNPFPSYRDLLSRGLSASLDCSAAKEALDWHPSTDRRDVIARGIAVYGVRRD